MPQLDQSSLDAIASLFHEHMDVMLERQELAYLRHLDYILTHLEDSVLNCIPNVSHLACRSNTLSDPTSYLHLTTPTSYPPTPIKSFTPIQPPAQRAIKSCFEEFFKFGLRTKASDNLRTVQAFRIDDIPRVFYLPNKVNFPEWQHRAQVWDVLVAERTLVVDQVEQKWYHLFDCGEFGVEAQGSELGFGQTTVTQQAETNAIVADQLDEILARGYLHTPSLSTPKDPLAISTGTYETPSRALQHEHLEPITAIRAFCRARLDSSVSTMSPLRQPNTKPLYSAVVASPTRPKSIQPLSTRADKGSVAKSSLIPVARSPSQAAPSPPPSLAINQNSQAPLCTPSAAVHDRSGRSMPPPPKKYTRSTSSPHIIPGKTIPFPKLEVKQTRASSRLHQSTIPGDDLFDSSTADQKSTTQKANDVGRMGTKQDEHLVGEGDEIYAGRSGHGVDEGITPFAPVKGLAEGKGNGSSGGSQH